MLNYIKPYLTVGSELENKKKISISKRNVKSNKGNKCSK